MGLPKYAARTDANKAPIVQALKAEGFSVYDLRLPLDLMVGAMTPHGYGVTIIMEIKDGGKSPSRREHTYVQSRFLASWPGPTCSVTDPEGAVRAVRSILEHHKP